MEKPAYLRFFVGPEVHLRHDEATSLVSWFKESGQHSIQTIGQNNAEQQQQQQYHHAPPKPQAPRIEASAPDEADKIGLRTRSRRRDVVPNNSSAVPIDLTNDDDDDDADYYQNLGDGVDYRKPSTAENKKKKGVRTIPAKRKRAVMENPGAVLFFRHHRLPAPPAPPPLQLKVDELQGRIAASFHLLQSLPEDRECMICLDLFTEGNNVRMLKCGCLFHFHCINQWLSKKTACPLHWDCVV